MCIPAALTAQAGIQGVSRTLAQDAGRTAAIAADIVNAYAQGRTVLVLTECTEHLAAFGTALAGRVPRLFTLYGRVSTKQRAALLDELRGLPA